MNSLSVRFSEGSEMSLDTGFGQGCEVVTRSVSSREGGDEMRPLTCRLFATGDDEFGLLTRFLNSPRLQKGLPCHPLHLKSYPVLEVLLWSERAVCTCGVE